MDATMNLEQSFKATSFLLFRTLIFAFLSHSANGQDSADIDAALIQLLQDVEIERYLETQELERLVDGTYRIKPGDTLDQIITLTMPDSKMKMSFLRQAFVQANPSAFRSSNPNRLVSGMDIRLPNADDILSLLFISVPTTIKGATGHWISYP
ncbi:MAG: hypothetical protein CMQ14_05600 [Gammaproteobacteria bacterium]|nr:hypothetical protein [Gammaproteobacteria bacterium]|tara:strand:+ start:787 stop:1245 length:459 start_codon:yes stop_codon:yes gene_type:complete